ncbi:hypothetical protein [Xenorhabdus sp. BG5]|uniref:hypothetical protein n=1 Tax=Xenorhabdus sp. BG5 TaxID=2782014 RepID=UPI00187EDA7D|nr:hypothetical protein [Xenorhabdus sp. BG5]MBE8597403.1 hypothetical protein [Xenorhabdus sp. BG5]
MPINPQDPFKTSFPLVRRRPVLRTQAAIEYSGYPSLGADILSIYLEYLIQCRFLSVDGFGRLTIRAAFADLAYGPINLLNIESYLNLLGFTPTLALNGVKYVQTRYPNVRSLADYEENVLPAIKRAWTAHPPY